MKKSFPTVLNKRLLRWLTVAGTAGLTGCVGYYPEPYSTSPQPYYSGGGGDGYYDSYSGSPYYGPAYGGTTIYYENYAPGYYYRPGYGYYPPSRPPSGGHGHDHDDHDGHDGGNNHSDNVKRAWSDRFDVTGENPGRYPHDRDGNSGRDNGSKGRDNDSRGNGRVYSAPQQAPQQQRDNDNRGGGWAGRISPGANNAPAPRQSAAPAPPRPSNPPPPRADDRGSSRGAWADRLKKSD